jgi:hypothetical protein
MYVRTAVPMTITVSSQNHEDDVVIDSRSPYKVLPLWAAQRVEFQELWDENKVEVATDTGFTNIITSIPISELGDAVPSVAGLIGEISASGLRTALSINNVDNTSDATKNSAVATLTNKTLTAAVVDAPSGQDPLLVRVGGNTAFTFNQYGELLSLAGYGIFYDGNVSNTAFSSTGPLFLTSGKSTENSHDVTLKPSGTGKIKLLAGSVEVNGAALKSGTGSPEGTVVAPVGSLYLRSDGGAGTTLYVKESGTGNTGWSAK